MKTLVTGANGYLGRSVVDELLKRGNEVIATDFACDHVNPVAHRVLGDIFPIEDPHTYLGEPDVVLHLAWCNGLIHNSNTHFEDLPKYVALLKKLYESGIQQVACAGPMHETGFHEGSINAHTPCWPMSMYRIAKNALRSALQTIVLQDKVKFQWFRGYYIVSDTQHGSSTFSKIVAVEIEGKKEFLFATGQNQYDFLDYLDFCHQIIAAVNQDEVLGITNICSGKPEKPADRAERLIAENGFSIKLKYGTFPDRPYDSKTVRGDASKITRIPDTEH